MKFQIPVFSFTYALQMDMNHIILMRFWKKDILEVNFGGQICYKHPIHYFFSLSFPNIQLKQKNVQTFQNIDWYGYYDNVFTV